jgi:predicted CXXCH cytochrome family protein
MLAKEVPALCFDCHSAQDPGLVRKHWGISLASVDCGSCHDPHASTAPALAHAIAHDPYVDGDCSDCHDKVGDTPDGEMQLCFGCHPGMGEDVKTSGLHKPLSEDRPCTVCHEPHTAPQAKLLPVERDRLCGRCHEEILAGLSTSVHAHPAQSTGTCSVCHDPHFNTDEENVSLADRRCASCHPFQDHVMHPMGPDVIDPRTNAALRCASCHYPHGSDHEYILRDDPSGPLCVGCHPDKIRTK